MQVLPDAENLISGEFVRGGAVADGQPLGVEKRAREQKGQDVALALLPAAPRFVPAFLNVPERRHECRRRRHECPLRRYSRIFHGYTNRSCTTSP